MTRTELVDTANKQNGKVQDMRAARAHLVNTKLLDKDQNFGRAELFTTLMKISLLPQAAIGKMSNTLHALAYMSEYVDSEVAQEVADCTAAAVSEALSPVAKGTDMAISLAGEATQVCARATAAADSVRAEMLELKEQFVELKEIVQGCQNLLQGGGRCWGNWKKAVYCYPATG
jgi:hypothetical protein